jgi:hypothetical protein
MDIDVRLASGGAVALDVDQITIDGTAMAFLRSGTVVSELSCAEVAQISLEFAIDTTDEAGGPSYSVEAIRETYPNAYARWTADEDSRLLESHAREVPIAEIAAAHGRQTSAINSRLVKLLPLLSDHKGGSVGSLQLSAGESGHRVSFSEHAE